jgi:hypothetical protein
MMVPTEFIGRCLDAAHVTLRESLPGPLSTTSFQVAGLTLHALPGPLSFDMNDYTFTVEMSDMHEMMQITAVMSVGDDPRYTWEATMVLSKMTGSSMGHWLCDEPEEETHLVLFKLMTSNRFELYGTLQ